MRQKLGQHFLTNPKILRRIAEEFLDHDSQTIIEIGPGHGELTLELIKNTTSKIIAIERDAELAQQLIKKFENEARLKIIEGDALYKLDEVAKELKREKTNYNISGNIPYYITGHLLRVLGELDFKPQKTVLTIQKEVAERIMVSPPEMNRLAAAMQFWADPKIIQIIKKEEFKPKPKVDSATIVLETKKTEPLCEPKLYDRAIGAIFKQPRKNILNNLSSTLPDLEKNEIEKTLLRIGISPTFRPQNLSISDIAIIGEKILKK